MTTEPQAPAAPTEAPHVTLPHGGEYFQTDFDGRITAQWAAFPPVGHTLEQMLRPSYWAHHAAQLQRKPNALIRVLPAGGGWWAMLGVIGAGNQAAQVFVMNVWPHGSVEAPQVTDGLFKIEFVPAHKWRIIRKSDNAVVEKDLPTRAAAIDRLPELLKRAA